MKYYCKQCGAEFRLNRGKQIYCSRACVYAAKVGPGNGNYRGGFTRADGYRVVMVNGKRMLEHRLVMEGHLGRPLSPTEVVRHKDGNPSNNAIENLVVQQRQGAHIARFHCHGFRGVSDKECLGCRIVKPRSEFSPRRTRPGSLADPHDTHCKQCKARLKRERYARRKAEAATA